MIEEVVDVKTVQYWIGHSSVEVIYNICAHVQEQSKKATAQVHSDLLKKLLIFHRSCQVANKLATSHFNYLTSLVKSTHAVGFEPTTF